MKQVIDKIKAGGRLRQHLIEYGFATVLIAVVVWFVVSKNMQATNKEVKAEVEKTHNTVNQIQSRIDSVRAYQDLLIQKTNQLEVAQQQTMHLIETGNSLLIQNRRAIEKIRLENNEKITGAANYNYKQLDSFFSSRYQGH
jgi:hypothetical protein